MEYRLPMMSDKEIIKEYIEDHYSHNEKSLSASNMLTSMEYEDWVKKFIVIYLYRIKIGVNQ